MLKNGFKLSLIAKKRFATNSPNPANSQKWAKLLTTLSSTGRPARAVTSFVKNPLVEEDSSPFCAERQNIVIKTAITAIAEIAI